MPYFELTPAYGRDYGNAASIKAAFHAHQDFQVDYQMGFSLINKPQIPIESIVALRYGGNRKVVVIAVTDHAMVPIESLI